MNTTTCLDYRFYPHLKPKDPLDPFDVWWSINGSRFGSLKDAARAAWEESQRLEREYGSEDDLS